MGGDSSKPKEAFVIKPATAGGGVADSPTTPDGAPPDPAQLDPVELGSEPVMTAPETQPSDSQPLSPPTPDTAPATAESGVVQVLGADEPVTPVPDDLEVGNVVGHGIAVAGDDFEQGTVTLVAYDTPTGEQRQVLYGWLNPAAEERLFAGLSADGQNLVPVQVTEQITGRLPLDTDNQLHEKLAVVAKSVNYHLKNGSDIPDHTHTNLDELVSKLSELSSKPASDAETGMLDTYTQATEQLAERMTPGYDTPYTEGGKTPLYEAVKVDSEIEVTKMVPGPPDPDQPTLLPMTKRSATRIDPTINNGKGTWDGTSRTTASGSEYVIDLADGYTAIYRPHDPTLGGNKAAKGQQGFLEIIAPQGAGHTHGLVERLGQLNLVNQPVTAAEAEYTYLERQAWALKAENKAAVVNARANAAAIEDTMVEIVFAERAASAPDDPADLDDWVKDVQLEGQRRAQPAKATVMAEAVAPLLGHNDGDSLRADPNYNPVPTASGGWLTWERFDVASDRTSVRESFGTKALVHRVTGNNIPEIFKTGVLAATERRRVMGIGQGKGMSETADMNTGGSRVVDLRVLNTNHVHSGPYFVWDDPTKLMARSDWYAYNGDKFAALDGHSQIRSPHKAAAMTAGNNEVLFHNGIDLTGPEAPDRIFCSSPHQKSELLAVLAKRGITQLGGKPVNDVIQ